MKARILFMILWLHAVSGWCSEKPLVITINQNFPPFSFLNVESKPAGMFVDIWRLWSEKIGREVEFRPETWVDTLKCFKSGEAQIHGGLFRTPEREKWIAFSRPFYEIDIHLIYPSGDGQIRSLFELAGQRVGVHLGTDQEAWLRDHFPDVEVTPMVATRDLIFAAKRGEISAFMADAQTIWAHLYQLGLSAEFKTAAKPLYSKAFHAGVSKTDPRLLEWVNQGFDAISERELAEIEARWLHAPGFSSQAEHIRKPQFSDGERRFIKTHPVVRVGLIPGFEPYMFVGREGTFHGIIPDYLRLMEERTGLVFKSVAITLSELDDIMGADIDIFPGLESPERSQRMVFTEAILSDPWVLVNRHETPMITGLRDLDQRVVSFVKGIYIQNRLKADYPKIRMLPAAGHLEALQKVSMGAADACIGPLSVAGSLIHHNRLTNLKIASPAEYPPAQVKFGVRNDRMELVSILNKAIASVTRRELDDIYHQWVPVEYEQRVDWKRMWKWIAGVVAVFGLLLCVSLWWNRKLTIEIRERKKAEHELHQIEWLLTKSVSPSDARQSPYFPPYGDVTALNTRRVILDYVGKETLSQIAEDTIDLLDTSVAIYEENGDYAFGMFSSGWCRMFDSASRNLCQTDDNREALTCGKWLCHDNCWNDSAKTAIQSGKPTDIECVGGIHLYAVPIFARKMVIGSINIGYGDPPTDEATLLQLSNRFNLDLDEIRKAAAAYQSRPKYIIDLAKKRLQTAADLIGEIVVRRLIENALRESEANLKLLFSNMPAALFLHDLDGRILMTNRLAETYTGYTRDELSHLKIADLDHQSVTRDDRKHIWRQLQLGRSKTIESVHFRKDGSEYPVEIHITASTMRNQPVILGMAQDITDRKEAEARLREYSENLEKMVKARTQALEQAQAELLVKERLAVLGHFAGSISHELRNPLAVIEGASYLLNTKLEGDETFVPVLERISRNVQKSTAIIQSLLNLSRMEKPETVKTNLADVIAETLRSSKIPQSVEVIRRIPEQAIMVDIEVEQIRMALKNIVKNAVQAMEEKGTLTITGQETQAAQVELTITDTGPGIAPENLEKVFEPLFSTKTHGIGFGLSITRMIIENHGGSIRVESRHGEGAVFTLTLPSTG